MKKGQFIMTTIAALSLITVTAASANECTYEYTRNFIRASGGIRPPQGQAEEYCECAEAALTSGDTLSSAVNLCVELIKNLYKH